MKALTLSLSLAAAVLITGCTGVAVVEDRPRYGYVGTRVYYEDDRPYYYSSGVRYWGYPRGYSGPRRSYTRVDVDRDVEINRTRNVYNRNVTKVYRDGDARRSTQPANVRVKAQPTRGDQRQRDDDDDKKRRGPRA